MAASDKTVKQVADILLEEVGIVKALAITRRLRNETTGNRSFRLTVMALHEQIARSPELRK